MTRLKPASLDRVKTIPLAERRSLVEASDFARAPRAGLSVREFLDGLPRILAGRELRELAERVAGASSTGKMVLAGIGGHVIKCGLGPVLVELMKRGVLGAIAMNGAASIHDFEIAISGKTSEDVQAGVDRGEFGFAEETGRLMNDAIIRGAGQGIGMGEALGGKLLELSPPWLELSVLAAARRLELPVTVHVAIGTDVTHQHPAASGGAIGEASFTDFKLLVTVVSNLTGGVVLNIGSAVVLPEVFIKALSVARNLGHEVKDFTTANLDFIQHYRPLENVVRRPVSRGGRGIVLTGHHEILVPLLAAAVLERLDQGRRGLGTESK